MTRRRMAAAAAIVLAVAVALLLMLSRSPERQIRRQLDNIADTVNAPATGLDAMANAARIGRSLTDDVMIDFGDAPPIHGRETVMAVAARLHDRARRLDLSLRDVNVTVAPDRVSADVTLTAVVTSDDTTDAREFELRMVKPQGTWLISSATAIKVLQK